MTTDGPPPPPAAAAVGEVLRTLGASGALVPIPGSPDPAAIAVAAGVPPAAVARSDVFAADGRPLVVVTSAVRRADPITLAALLGVNRIEHADPVHARRWTGQDPAAAAPVGHPEPLPTLVDVELAGFRTIWCPAGQAGWAFPTTYAELLRMTAGEAAEVGDLSAAGTP